MRPIIIFLTQLDFDHMRQLLYEEEEADIFLPKPLSSKTLLNLLNLVNFIW